MKNSKIQRIAYLTVGMVLIAGYVVNLSAQERKKNPAHVGIIYPLSTNGKTAPSDTNDFSLHLVAGVSQQENVLYIAGVSGVVIGNAYGTMVSGVSNHVGNDAKGVQVAGVLNRIKQHASGVQIAGLANVTGGKSGAQIAGLANVTGGTSGVQIAGLLNNSGDATMQIAGLINIAKKVKGVQLAGLINIAEESKYPIGVLNIIKEGEMLLGVTVDEGGNTVVALRSGGKVLYGVLGIGYNFKDREARYVLEGGIGAHLITANRFRMNAELVSTAMTSFDDGVYGKQSLRAFVGYRITPRVELFAGPTFNHLLFDTDMRDIRNDRYLWRWSGDEKNNGFFIGGMAGLQISL